MMLTGSRKRPRWADLVDSSEENASQELPPAPLRVDSYDGKSTGAELNELRQNFSSTLSGVLSKDAPPVGSPLVDAAKHALLDDNEKRTWNNIGTDGINLRTLPKEPNTSIRERLQGAPSPQVDQATAIKRVCRSASSVPGGADSIQKRALDGWLEDDVILINDDPASWTCAQCTLINGNSLKTCEACGAANPSQHAACDDEDWARRFEKRQTIVVTIKASPQYKAHAQRRADGCPDALDVPRTPDPSHRDVSKRAWERDVQKWRVALRAQLPGELTP